MITHVVMFKFKDKNREANMSEVKKALEQLPQKIDPLLSLEVGIDFDRSERAMDMVLISTFADKNALKRYATHKEHLKVVELIKAVTTGSKVVDFASTPTQ